MKKAGVLASAVFFLLLGRGVVALAQNQDAGPAQQDEKAQPQRAPEARPAHPPEMQPPQHAEPRVAPAPQVEHPPAEPPKHEQQGRTVEHPPAAQAPQNQPTGRQPEARPNPTPQHESEGAAHATRAPQITPEQRRVQQTAWQAHRAQHWQSEHRDWRQRGGYHGYRIPEQRYVAYFGPSHVFPIYTVPVVVVGGYPRFQYEGFWFTVLDPWPEDWADDWFYTDDVYVVYQEEGYYLVDQRHPGVFLAINVST